MRRTYQTFTLFATGIVSPRVALFRKPDPTNCTVLMPPSHPPATDEFDSLHVGLVITLGVLAVVLLLTVSIVVHLIRMVRPAPSPVPAPTPRTLPCARTHPPDAAALRGLASTPRPSAPPLLPPTLTRAPPLPQEKKGSPLFMPLMKERDVEAVAYPAKGADANTI